ncbi:DUF6296 family protein [Streptomyces sp. TLI_235]|uniref:DUF6296 family protein n=1 Tax=Kitasatospora sp. NPDC085879 TaxID=3154769 RepID=UPI00211C0F68|nr:DUF6296 family protein [Streptomyces sp. TLI_235]
MRERRGRRDGARAPLPGGPPWPSRQSRPVDRRRRDRHRPLAPGGHMICTDESGRLQVEITEHGAARLLTPTPLHHGPLHAEPLP